MKDLPNWSQRKIREHLWKLRQIKQRYWQNLTRIGLKLSLLILLYWLKLTLNSFTITRAWHSQNCDSRLLTLLSVIFEMSWVWKEKLKYEKWFFSGTNLIFCKYSSIVSFSSSFSQYKVELSKNSEFLKITKFFDWM